jgi:hypothetical protein
VCLFSQGTSVRLMSGECGLISSLDSYIWNRVWTMTDGGRPLELAKLDVAVVPIVKSMLRII